MTQPDEPAVGDCYYDVDEAILYTWTGIAWKRVTGVSQENPVKYTIPGYARHVPPKGQTVTIGKQGVYTTIGHGWGDRQCPVWLPQDPNVRHEDRTRCVRWGPHDQHSDTYLIEEQTLD